MASIAEVLAAIDAAPQTINEARMAAHQAAEKLGDAHGGYKAVFTGSTNPKTGATVKHVEDAAESLGESEKAVQGALTDLAAYVAIITGGTSGRAQDASGEGGQDAPPRGGNDDASPPPQTTRARLPSHDPRRPHPSAVASIERYGWPRNHDGRVAARGDLYVTDGHRVNLAAYKAHRKGEQPHRSDLTDPFNDAEHTTTTWHAEADMAQAIRDLHATRGVREFALYLNVPVCGATGPDNPHMPDPRRCLHNLPRIIPEGVAVYVHVIPERGTPTRIRIVGTGEGIRHD